ncbi:MAG: ParB/RepB/Spo0J family partition protein [Planctomycetaceae bacterium]|nr:ParB/RepB/Spo0J family partition protein [Planctomycetaceae bacterium]
MGKFDDLTRALGGNVAESMGVGRQSIDPLHVADAALAALPERMKGVNRTKGAVDIPIDRISSDPDQPREDFDEESLRRLADSMKQRGQLQPIRVRWDEGGGSYVIICGERRWRAAILAGLTTVSAVVVEGEISQAELLAIQLVENCLREDLKPIEQAKAYKALMDRNEWSTRQLAAELAITQGNIVRALALLNLPERVQDQVEAGQIAPATAYEISKVESPAEQEQLASRAVEEKLTRADVVAAREQKTAKPRLRRVEIKVAGAGQVVVNLADPDADDDSVLFALQQAVKQFRKTMAAHPEVA